MVVVVVVVVVGGGGGVVVVVVVAAAAAADASFSTCLFCKTKGLEDLQKQREVQLHQVGKDKKTWSVDLWKALLTWMSQEVIKWLVSGL